MDIKQHLVNVFKPPKHNIRYYRLIYKYIPGRPWHEWSGNQAARHGHLELVRYLRSKGVRGTFLGANMAAGAGHLHIIRDLRLHCVNCTQCGADYAARGGHLDVVRDLRDHNIHCTSRGADWAAENGHLRIVQNLREHGVRCTSKGANAAAKNGHSEVVCYLMNAGIIYDSYLVDLAARAGQLERVQNYRMRYNLHCTPMGADLVAEHGHLDVLQDLASNGVFCTHRGIELAKKNKHACVVRYLEA